MVLGHESAATVVAMGSAVKKLQVGDRVALEPGYPCRRCDNCFAGRYNLCHEMIFAATPPYDGTLTGFWVAPSDFCYKLPENVSLQEGALIEPLAVAVHMVKQAPVVPGQSVVVMGAGTVGLLCAAAAKSFGAAKNRVRRHCPSKARLCDPLRGHAHVSVAARDVGGECESAQGRCRAGCRR